MLYDLVVVRSWRRWARLDPVKPLNRKLTPCLSQFLFLFKMAEGEVEITAQALLERHKRKNKNPRDGLLIQTD